MLELCLALVPALAPPQEKEPPDPAVVAAAIEGLKAASKLTDSTERAEAIRLHGAVEDDEVVALVAKSLGDSVPLVQGAAIYALRYNGRPASLDALHRAYKKEKKLREHRELAPQLVKAIGQHASEKSIALLAADTLSDENRDRDRARILSLGNIRDERSVEALLTLLRKAEAGSVQTFMGELRVALMVLTGVDRGDSQDAWIEWWADNAKTLQVADTPPKLPERQRRLWEYFWDLDRTYDRAEKRADRGRDPERD
jgi:HEAT repeat protein